MYRTADPVDCIVYRVGKLGRPCIKEGSIRDKLTVSYISSIVCEIIFCQCC